MASDIQLQWNTMVVVAMLTLPTVIPHPLFPMVLIPIFPGVLTHLTIPPHFFMGQPSPRYEYDKEMRGGHCCGCPNHACQPKQNKGVRIEEHEPEPLNNDALAPAVFEGAYPSPYVCFPPEYVKDKDGTKFWNGWRPIGLKNYKDGRDEKVSESLQKAGNTNSNDDRSNEERSAPFPFPVFWFPGYNRLEESRNKDMKNDKESRDETTSESPLKHGDVKSNDQNNTSFPFPVFWFPNDDRLKESGNKDVKASDSSPQVMEERQPKLKIIPVTSPGNDDRREKPVAMDDRYGKEVEEKGAKVIDLHVQPNEEPRRNESTEAEKRPTEIQVRKVKQDEKEPCGKKFRSQSSFQSKASKLPPVCLRVDPLPRRKSGGGTSRSPSPPAVKSKVFQDSAGGKSCSGQVEQVLQGKFEEAEPRKDMIDPMAIEENLEPNGKEVPRKCDHAQIENVDGNASTKEVLVTQATVNGQVCERETASQGNETTETMPLEDGKAKQKLSTMEAAVLIQSFYRGFQVRKWHPLTKLKQIARVREQVNEVGARVQTLEASSELKKVDKERILIGEAIMSLLLQLDAIQGLHPAVRDIRKSVAKELTSLQEKLDSLISACAAEEHMPELTNMQQAPFKLDIGDEKPECVEWKLMDTEHQHKVMEQCPDLAEMESTEKAAEAGSQVSAKLPMETEPRSDFSSSPTEKVQEADEQRPAGEADQQLTAEIQVFTKSPLGTEPRNDFSSTEKVEEADQPLLAGEADQQLTAEIQVFTKSPLDNEYRNDFSSEPTAMSLAENESGCECSPEVAEKVENSDQQLLPMNEAPGEAHQPVPAEDQLSATSPTENEYRNSCPPECADQQLEAADDKLLSTKSSSSFEGEGCHLTPPAMEDDKKVTGEPGCCSGVVESVEEPQIEVTEMTGKAPILGVEQSVEERNPCDSEGENRASAARVMDSFTVDFGSESVAEPIAEELREDLDDIPFCSVGNNQDGGLENNLQDNSALVRDTENESGNGDSVLKGDEESRCMANREADVVDTREDLHGGLECPTTKEDGADEHSFDNDVIAEPANMRGTFPMDGESGAGKGHMAVAQGAGEREGESGEMGEAVDKKLSKENEKLRDVLGKLVEEGEKQMKVISDLNGRIKELERKLTKKSKVRMRKHSRAAPACAHLKQSIRYV